MVEVTYIIVGCVIFLLSYYLLNGWKKSLPGPLRLPIVGSLPWLIRAGRQKKTIPQIIFEEAKKYGNGDIFCLRIGSQDLIVLNGLDCIQDAFVKNSQHFSDRPHWLRDHVERKYNVVVHNGIVWSSGDEWKVLRRFTMHALRDFGVGKLSIEMKILEEVEATADVFTKSGGEPMDVSHLLPKLVTNVICGVVFGKRFEYSDEKFAEIIKKVNIAFSQGNPLDPTVRLPDFLIRLISSEKYEIMQKRGDIIGWLTKYIQSEIDKHEASFDKENIRDFVDLYIKSREEDSEMQQIESVNMFYVILDLFLAGSETTSTTLKWCLLYLMEYPDIQKKCQEEITQVVGERSAMWKDRNSMPYVQATLLEIQRISNIGEFTVPHTCQEEVTFRGHVIPKHATIAGNIYSCTMSPEYWDRPEVFQPGRFLDDEGKIKKINANIPFGIGPRQCMGESMAKMELFLAVTNLLQRFTFKRENENVPHGFDIDRDQLTRTPSPYRIRAIPRHMNN